MRASMRKRPTFATRLLRIFCATLMLSLGFAHKPVAMMAAPPLAFDEAYRLPDGRFAEICEGHAGVETAHTPGKKDHSSMPSLFCEACLLSSSILVPKPDTHAWVRAHFAWLDNRPTLDVAVVRHVDDQRPKARAPPIFL
ncbi:hypothetical protein A6R70_06565 [Agrobacterium rubi]|nr:hypothetical protein [Agrobacterium rubi]